VGVRDDVHDASHASHGRPISGRPERSPTTRPRWRSPDGRNRAPHPATAAEPRPAIGLDRSARRSARLRSCRVSGRFPKCRST
jgi:hypothetical protein